MCYICGFPLSVPKVRKTMRWMKWQKWKARGTCHSNPFQSIPRANLARYLLDFVPRAEIWESSRWELGSHRTLRSQGVERRHHMTLASHVIQTWEQWKNKTVHYISYIIYDIRAYIYRCKHHRDSRYCRYYTILYRVILDHIISRRIIRFEIGCEVVHPAHGASGLKISCCQANLNANIVCTWISVENCRT